MGITRVELFGRPALACRGCGEIIVFMGRESDWFEPDADGRLRSFVCSGFKNIMRFSSREVAGL